jgi:hypothetical protein
MMMMVMMDDQVDEDVQPALLPETLLWKATFNQVLKQLGGKQLGGKPINSTHQEMCTKKRDNRAKSSACPCICLARRRRV